MRKRLISITALCIAILFLFGLNGCRNVSRSTTLHSDLPEMKPYEIPLFQQKRSYSVDEFKKFLNEFNKLNNIKPENGTVEMSDEDKQTFYSVYEITNKDIKKETGCQIFKVNNTCEAYIIYKSKLFHIGTGFGGYGILSIKTCDFDGNGHKDLIFTYSFGSGLHRSQIGIFNLFDEKEYTLDFQQMNKDIVLEKISYKKFNIYIADVALMKSLDYTHLKFTQKEKVAEVQKVDGKIAITKYNSDN